MEIKVSPGADAPELLAAEDFKSFKVTVAGDQAAGLAVLEQAGVGGDEGHVWVPVPLVRRLAGSAATEQWEASLTGMVKYAESKGWYDQARDAIRAHVEPA